MLYPVFNDIKMEHAYIIMSRIIRDHGSKYLPIFQRIHEERLARKRQQDLTQIALHAAALPLEFKV